MVQEAVAGSPTQPSVASSGAGSPSASPASDASGALPSLATGAAANGAAANGAAAAQGTATPGGKPPMRKRNSRLHQLGGASFGDLSGSLPGRREGVPRQPAEVTEALDARVREWGGDRPISSVLVANNGLAAVKFMRSVRSWAYKQFGSEQAVNLIAMATPEDMLADAEHVRLAGQFVEVPGGANLNNYANVQLIVATAVRTGVDAVWPGWGHASEKPELPAALEEVGIRFLGPPAGPMAALGDKIGSTILAQSAGVPTLAWSGAGVTVAYGDCPGGVIPEDVYDKACIHSLPEALEACQRIGYPIMLKASWGGGGKGIRKVLSDEDVRLVFRQVQGEVPGSPVFAMKLAPQSRHLEVQLLADSYGSVVSLFSRDCSVQRRHQKIVEEGPVTCAPSAALAEMERCARALARSVGYVGAATVEFLYAMESGEVCFLELNPRLQVEHPVTEWISGVNIPAAQLLIAAGVPLHRIPDVRRLYDRDPAGDDAIDFEAEGGRLPSAGHVVAVRITAENANDGFKPTSGRIEELSFRSTPEVWGYFSVKGGGAIHEFSDSQFGHLFAKGESREAAVRAMVVALKEVKIRGEVRTIVDYATDLLQAREFWSNAHHTGWLDARIAAQVRSERPPWHLAVIAGTVLRAVEQIATRSVEYLSYLEKGQLPPSRISLVTLTEEFVVDGVKYRVRAVRTGPHSFTLHLGGTAVDVVVRKLNDGGLLLQVDGQSHVIHSEEEAAGTRLNIGPRTCLLSNEHDPSSLLSMSTGKLVRYLVDDGGRVEADQPYAEVEVMKMVMTLLAPAAGVLRARLAEGAVLAPGLLIASLDLDDPGAVRRAELFTGSFPSLGPPLVASESVSHRFRAALEGARNILAGYHNPVDAVVAGLLSSLDDPALALQQWEEQFAAVQSRLPSALANQLESIVDGAVLGGGSRLPSSELASPAGGGHPLTPRQPRGFAQQLIAAMERAVEEAAPAERAPLSALLEPLMEVARAHCEGKEGFARRIASSLLEAYLAVEERFETGGRATEQEVIDSLRLVHSSSLQSVLDLVLAHQSQELKSALLQRLLAALVLPAPQHYRRLLRRLAALSERGAAEVAASAQQLLEHSLLGELRAVVARALSGLDMFAEGAGLAAAAGELLLQGGDAPSPIKLEGLALAAAPAASPAPEAGLVMRRMTVMEGLYAGLANVPPGGAAAAAAAAGVAGASLEARMSMLVEAPAAVEDALASLLMEHGGDPALQQRALSTYIRRLYHPHLLQSPELLAPPRPPAAAAGGEAAPAPAPLLLAAWAYDDHLDSLRE